MKSKNGGLGSDDRVRMRAYAEVLRQGNVMETDTPNRRGYECQSARTFDLISRQMLNFGGLFRQLLHAFL